jgi:hypothetical protein
MPAHAYCERAFYFLIHRADLRNYLAGAVIPFLIHQAYTNSAQLSKADEF